MAARVKNVKLKATATGRTKVETTPSRKRSVSKAIGDRRKASKPRVASRKKAASVPARKAK